MNPGGHLQGEHVGPGRDAHSSTVAKLTFLLKAYDAGDCTPGVLWSWLQIR